MSDLVEIENIFDSNNNFIQKIQINKWKQSSNREVLGALVELLMDKKYYEKITPKLVFEDYYPFLFDYYINCMQEDFDGEWAHSDYIASYELRSFIEGIWNDKQLSEEKKINLRKEIKYKLEKLSLKANESFKKVIINGLLEHLFENQEIKNYFKDWKKKDTLNIFYTCAINKNEIIE